MRLGTHFVCAFLLVASALSKITLSFLYVAGFMLGSVLPDVLEMLLKTRHRSKLFHNVCMVIPVSLLAVLSPDLVSVAFGYLHHLLLDMLTVQGIYILNRKVRWRLKSRDMWHNLVILLIHLIIALLVIAH